MFGCLPLGQKKEEEQEDTRKSYKMSTGIHRPGIELLSSLTIEELRVTSWK